MLRQKATKFLESVFEKSTVIAVKLPIGSGLRKSEIVVAS
jgi:hypothetical protein